MVKYTKFAISLPNELVEVLDSFAEYEGFTRSSAVAYLLAKGLSYQASVTNDFDFNNFFDIYTSEDGEEIFLRRKDVRLLDGAVWCFRLGRNTVITNKDFLPEEMKSNGSVE